MDFKLPLHDETPFMVEEPERPWPNLAGEYPCPGPPATTLTEPYGDPKPFLSFKSPAHNEASISVRVESLKVAPDSTSVYRETLQLILRSTLADCAGEDEPSHLKGAIDWVFTLDRSRSCALRRIHRCDLR